MPTTPDRYLIAIGQKIEPRLPPLSWWEALHEVRVPADEVRPKCERCSVLLLDVERPVCPRPHEFAVTEMVVRMRDEERHLYPIPGGYEVR